MKDTPESRVAPAVSPYVWARLAAEHLLLSLGMALLLMYMGARIHAAIASRAALWSFQQLNEEPFTPNQEPNDTVQAHVDFRLSAHERVAGYMKALARKFDAPLGVLSIPRLQLNVPVFDGTDRLTLNRGAGRIAGTAGLGEQGNSGIAGHRDSFFRRLKDVEVGDRIELAMPGQDLVYTVDAIAIVGPSDTSLLWARPRPSLTLVTCYPFYFVGDAPERYIVQASLMNSERESSEFDPEISNINDKEKTQ